MQVLSPWRNGLVSAVVIASLLTGCTKKPEAPAPPDAPADNNAQQAPQAPPSAPTTPPANAGAKEYVDFGAANGARGDLDGAITAFNTAISLDPKFAPAYYNLGYAKSLQNKTDEALQAFDQAIQLNPDYRDAYNQRGNVKGRHGDFNGAISDFQQVIRIDPKLAVAYYNLGHVYYFTGNLDGAIKQLDLALSLDPNLPFAYYIRGLAKHAQGHNTDATADFRKSLGFNFPDAAFWVFLCETEDGLSDAARQDLTDALTKAQTFKPDDFPTAVGNFLLGHLPQDGLVAKAAEAKDDEKADFTCTAWYYAGVMQRLGGNTPGARDCFNKAIATGSKGSEEYVEAKRELDALPGF
jgi:tetratricopeptide (TPR) repeat protein